MNVRAIRRQYVLDAGALIAIEKAKPAMRSLLSLAVRNRVEFYVPATVLAQVWRDGAKQARLARALKHQAILVAPLDEPAARQVGILLAGIGTVDIADAHVVTTAKALQAPVITSGRGDITRLADDLTIIDI